MNGRAGFWKEAGPPKRMDEAAIPSSPGRSEIPDEWDQDDLYDD